jgi:hypothetical protein
MTRVGSLFTGYAGLDMAVHEVLGGTTAWVSDIDPGASRLAAYEWRVADGRDLCWDCASGVGPGPWVQIGPLDQPLPGLESPQ